MPTWLKAILAVIAGGLGEPPASTTAVTALRRWRPGQGKPPEATGRRLVVGRLYGIVLEGWIDPPRGRLPLTRTRWTAWPDGVQGGHVVANFFAFLLDAVVMSVRAAAPRHGLDRDRGNALFAAFCAAFAAAVVPRLPEGFIYLALDVGHHCGRSHLLVSAIRETRDPRRDSCLIAILPFTGPVERSGALGRLRALDGRERLVAVVIDLSDELAALIAAAWPWAIIVADLRHVVRQVLIPLAQARQAGVAILPRRLDAETPSGQRRDGPKALLERRGYRLDKAAKARRDLALAILGPAAGTIYRLKEAILDLYRLDQRAHADRRLGAIFAGLAALDPAAALLDDAITTLAVTWRERILNHFDHEITTAHVERMVGFFKTHYDVWSVSGPFDQHYVRLLVKYGGFDDAVVESIAWRIAETFRIGD